MIRNPRLSASVSLLAVALLGACGGSTEDASASAASASSSTATARTADPAPTGASPAAAPASEPLVAPSEPGEVVVYRSPTCGCCSSWVEHLRAEGFSVEVHDRQDMTTVKNLLGVPGRLRSCHTALVGDYLVEGHVPASTIRRLLDEGPRVAGIAVPGMPIGSPGMEVPGQPADPYDVLAFDGSGEVSVYEKH